MFTDIFQRYADRTLFECEDGRSFPYAAVLDLSCRTAIRDTFRRLVFCLCANEPGGLLGYLGLVTAGAVPMMLSATVNPSQLAVLLGRYRPAYAWCPLERMRESLGGRQVLKKWGYVLVALDYSESYSINNSLALLLSTSGSTGSPKFVRISNQNVACNARAISDYLCLTSEEQPITTLAPSYTYGLSILHSHLLNGCKIALTNRPMFDGGFWQFLKTSKATSMGGVPYQYEILRRLKFTAMDLPYLRTLTQAGGRLSPSLASEFAVHCASHGLRFFIMYGQSEATARISYLSPQRVLSKPGSIGQAIPGGKIWLEDESGNVQTNDAEAGQLVYQGKNVCMGYAENMDDLAKGDEFGGILRTGDVARRDEEGDYFIVGRLKRFLKLFGHRVNLQDLEDELSAAGHFAACAGRDDQIDIYLCNVKSEIAKLIKTQIIKKFLWPPSSVRILSVTHMPFSEAGKIQYSELPLMISEVLA